MLPTLETSSRRAYYVCMKLGHAAALGLAGWYLMLPPTISRNQTLAYEPLSEWKLVDKFDSKNACQQILAKLIERMPASAIDTARCVSDDDPHLTPEQKVPQILG